MTNRVALTGADQVIERFPSASAQIVIGTAGHVDHGKSALIRALTGIDPDRLIEEKTRQMTIDLGFAWIELPSGRRAGIIDVPGHERFIKNMLAGAGGIDLALLVIAASEGPMPQTREHLAILDLLGVAQGIVALTKSDMVDDEMIELVKEEVGDLLDGTSLAGSPIAVVSAVTGEGLTALVDLIDSAVSVATNAHQPGPPRLPIDRVFSMQGFGTVVTGTVIGGSLRTGQEVEIMPRGLATRIRGIQSHNQTIDVVQMGNRAAINVASVATEDIHRGDVLTLPGCLFASSRIDCRLTLLPSAPGPLQQNEPVDFFCGAMEVQAWPTLLDSEAIGPGGAGWVQFRLKSPVAVTKGDRFIVRRASPSETIGGGVVIDAHPQRHKRFRPDVISTLNVLEVGIPEELVYEALRNGPVERRQLLGKPPAGLDAAMMETALASLFERGDIVALAPSDRSLSPSTHLVASAWWEDTAADIDERLGRYHRDNPLRRGIQREELRSRLGIPQRPFDAIVATAAASGFLAGDGALIHLPAFTITFDDATKTVVDSYLAALRAHPASPPSPDESGIDEHVLGALVDARQVIRAGDGIAFDPAAYQDMVETVMNYLDEHGSITLAGFRDLFGTSRKYAQAVLEHFDQQKLTRRVGDVRHRYAVTSGK
ncbi:selenocysteine-specific translation elongation factor [soil metagenome]